MENNETESIRIDFDVWRELQTRRKTKAMTENDVLRDVLGLPKLSPLSPSLAIGDRVRHPAFGEGEVEMRTGQEITIRFAGESQPKVLRIPEAVQAGMVKVPKDIRFTPTPLSPTSPPKKLRVSFSDGTQLYDTQSVRTIHPHD